MTEMDSFQICQDFRLAVWDLALNPDEIDDKELLATYEKHLENCLICEGIYWQVKEISEDLKQTKLPEPPSDLVNKIKKRVSAFRIPHITRFIKYATAASVLAAIFVLLLIFVPKKALPEAVAEATELHNMFTSGQVKTLAEMTSYSQLDSYCQDNLSLPKGTIPNMKCCCPAKACCCPPNYCKVMNLNKGAWLVFTKDAEPISLFVSKEHIILPDSAKCRTGGMDCYMFPVDKLLVCAYVRGGFTYFWVSKLGEKQMHEIVAEAMK